MDYHLHLETDAQEGVIRLRLTDEHGTHLGDNQVRLADYGAAMWEGLFDTRAFVHRYRGVILPAYPGPATPTDLLARLGVFVAEHVLGEGIVRALTRWNQRRTLLVHLPPIKKNGKNDSLAVAVARVPWEIARPGLDQAPLLERNVVVRAVPAELDGNVPVVKELEEDETLRVLFVYAEAPGSRPLAMRLERERLVELFCDEILPTRNVEFDVLCHGVTRSRLEEQIRVARGYHLVHWSGHGYYDRLEIRGEDGTAKHLSGPQLVKLFIDAGGFIPHLVFLSACLSAALVEATDWDQLKAAVHSGEIGPHRKPPTEVSEVVKDQPGYTSTALALLRSGVPQVIAMRYEVGDPYARELARLFYARLLGDTQPDSAENALSLARHELLHANGDERRAFDVVDHATPLILGHARQPVKVSKGRSEQLKRRRPKPQPLLRGDSRELDPPENFVGRGEELTHLAERWLPLPAHGKPRKDAPAIAFAQGLAGLGKTALEAEAIHLWHYPHFKWVFALQAKPQALTVDEFYRRIHQSLVLESDVYREKCAKQQFASIYLDVSPHLTPAERYERMQENLVEALRDEAILMVLDNFETNLETVLSNGGYRCSEPEWDTLLKHLAHRLPTTHSRVLITCRHRIASLSGDKVVWLPLGPLPMAEAMIFIQGNDDLWRLAGKAETWPLVERLLLVSRGHPLILSRLATLADKPAALEEALGKLEQGLQALPDVFTRELSPQQKETERRYLEDVAANSIDLLIERASPLARRLLWIVTLANEPVPEDLLDQIWTKLIADEKQ